MTARALQLEGSSSQWWQRLGSIRVFGDDPPEVRSLLRALRFWPLVEKQDGEDGCWLWRGSYQPGSGMPVMPVFGRNTYETAAQVAWQLTYGYAARRHLYRTCTERRCVNPARRSRGTLKPPRKPRGGTPRHPDALKRDSAMLTLYNTGMTLDEIGQAFGVTRERVRQLIRPTEPDDGANEARR